MKMLNSDKIINLPEHKYLQKCQQLAISLALFYDVVDLIQQTKNCSILV